MGDKMISFTDEEKINAFDEIASCFYEKNFGQMTKADIELMMFHFYLEKKVFENTASDGTLDYNECSDYKISKELGITQQRVRNLKVRKQLVYPIEFTWETAFAGLIKNARYDYTSKKVIINIPDPNLYLEIQNYLEEKGSYIEKQLNSKVMKFRVEYFIDLCLLSEPEENKKRIIKSIRSQLKESDKNDYKLIEKDIGKSLIKSSIDLAIFLNSTSHLLSGDNQIAQAFICFFKNIGFS